MLQKSKNCRSKKPGQRGKSYVKLDPEILLTTLLTSAAVLPLPIEKNGERGVDDDDKARNHPVEYPVHKVVKLKNWWMRCVAKI